MFILACNECNGISFNIKRENDGSLTAVCDSCDYTEPIFVSNTVTAIIPKSK